MVKSTSCHHSGNSDHRQHSSQGPSPLSAALCGDFSTWFLQTTISTVASQSLRSEILIMSHIILLTVPSYFMRLTVAFDGNLGGYAMYTFVSGRYITYKSPFRVTEEDNGSDSAENGVPSAQSLWRSLSPAQSVSPAAPHAAWDAAFPRTFRPHFLPAPLLPGQPGVCRALSVEITLRSRPWFPAG